MSRFSQLSSPLMLVFLSIITLPFTASAEWFKRNAEHMGTMITVEVWADNANKADNAINAVMAEMQRIDHAMSPYKPESELSRVNRHAAVEPIVISIELFDLIKRAQAVSRLTEGAFDITFASVGQYYNYRDEIHPDEQQISSEIKHIDYRHLILDPVQHSIRFSEPGIKIDLGGIAKGHAVANALAILRQQGIRHGLVMAGGDTGLLGDRRGRPWLVGIQDPRNAKQQAAMIPLDNTAMSTSGDYERFFIEDGVRYHHIIHPKTGKSAQEVQSVSVIGPDSTMTDALSTSVFVLGVKKGLALINQLDDYDAIILDNKRKLHFSDGLLAQGH